MASATHKMRRSPDQELPDLVVPDGMQHQTFPAMGTTISMLLPNETALPAGARVRSLFAAWEETLSRFLPSSELSALNRDSGTPSTISPLLSNVLSAALDAAWATGGLYDPTLLSQLTQLGYDRSFDTLPDTMPANEHPDAPGGQWRQIKFDRPNRRVTLPLGTALDFGGIAKGMAVDSAIDVLRAIGVSAALINAGGDLSVYGLPTDADAWPIAIQGPRGETWTIPLHHGAMATSGIARRRWRQGDDERHHLLNPATGLPVQGSLWSASVVAARCRQAEVAAKAAFILGPAAGVQFLHEQRLAGMLVEESGRRHIAGEWPRTAGRAPL